MPEKNEGKSPGLGAGLRWRNIRVEKRGLWVDICASVQILIQKTGWGGQSEIFTVSRRLTPG